MKARLIPYLFLALLASSAVVQAEPVSSETSPSMDRMRGQMENMSPEQREAFMEKRKQIQEKLKGMTPEERKAFMQANRPNQGGPGMGGPGRPGMGPDSGFGQGHEMRGPRGPQSDRMQDRMEDMSPEQREAFMEKRKQIQEKLKGMTPEERKAFIQANRPKQGGPGMGGPGRPGMGPDSGFGQGREMRGPRGPQSDRMQDRMENMSPEQREAFMEKRKQIQEKLKGMTPEERKAFMQANRPKQGGPGMGADSGFGQGREMRGPRGPRDSAGTPE